VKRKRGRERKRDEETKKDQERERNIGKSAEEYRFEKKTDQERLKQGNCQEKVQ
jgi:hypothetical protein